MTGTDAGVAQLVERLLRHYDAIYNWDKSSGQMIREAAAALAQQATQLQEARAALLQSQEAQGWQPIETAPHAAECFFWCVPKLPQESYTDTSGKPIVSMTGESYIHRGRLRTWGSLSKATHWMPLPSPPVAPAQKDMTT